MWESKHLRFSRVFRWTFNNSAEAKEVESRFIRTNGSRSVLTFTPTRTLVSYEIEHRLHAVSQIKQLAKQYLLT